MTSPALNKPLRTLEQAQRDRLIRRLTLLANRLEHDGLMQRNAPTADAADWGNHLVQDAGFVRQAIRELERLRGLVDFWTAAAHDRDIVHTKMKEAEQRAEALEKRVKELEGQLADGPLRNFVDVIVDKS